MKEMACNLCGFKNYSVVYHFKKNRPDGSYIYRITQDTYEVPPVKIIRCKKCGLNYVNSQEDLSVVMDSYRGMQDNLYIAEEKGRRLSARLILKRISKFKQTGKILDIGCSAGFLLDEARKIGWDAYGVELSKWAVNFSKEKLGLANISEGSLKEAKFPYNYFDVIVMMDIIEHLLDPRATLEELRRILKPNGIIFISTPDINSLASRILKARWWGVQRAHLFYFSKNTLKKMLVASGFEIMRFRSHSRVFSIDYWRRRLLGYNNYICKFLISVSKMLPSRYLLRLNLYDQIEAYAVKKRALRYVNDDEIKEYNQRRKMKTVVVLPAYNAAKTLELTLKDIPKDIVDDIILVDDKSDDNTVELARKLGLKVFVHSKNMGYGANQKTCYLKALETGAEIIVMVHPDYQYDPSVIPELIGPIEEGRADAVFGSRMMKGGALEGGMPLWKHNANILLTALENVVLGTYLTEYHSGFRAYSAKYLNAVNFAANSNSFIFDTEIIVQGLVKNMRIEEIPIRTRYFNEASTIKLWPAVVYGLKILAALFKYILYKKRIIRFRQLE